MCLIDARRKGIYSATEQLRAAAGTSPGTPNSVQSSTTTAEVSVTVNQVPLNPVTSPAPPPVSSGA
eukprot:8576830-Prorocentrum_lima.AAC.1